MSGIPMIGRGCRSEAKRAAYEEEVREFCARMLEIKARLDFEVSSRGWCYVLENLNTIDKTEFDTAERTINDWRKAGFLPLDICAEDERRSANGGERVDTATVDEEAERIVESVQYEHLYYTPFSFWEPLDYYVEIAVEKIDLKSLFAKVAGEFRIEVTNFVGWADINSRAAAMRRFKKWEARGKRPVLLYCGDFDPKGLEISDQLRSNFADLTGATGWDPRNLIIDRFGLNRDFIDANKLPWIENLLTGGKLKIPLDDPHHPDHYKPYVQRYLREHGVRKVEANALVIKPEAGRALCRSAILKYIPEDAPAKHEKRLAEVREKLRLAVLQRLGLDESDQDEN